MCDWPVLEGLIEADRKYDKQVYFNDEAHSQTYQPSQTSILTAPHQTLHSFRKPIPTSNQTKIFSLCLLKNIGHL